MHKLDLPKGKTNHKINSMQLQRKMTLGILDKLVSSLSKDKEKEDQPGKELIKLKNFKLTGNHNIDKS